MNVYKARVRGEGADGPYTDEHEIEAETAEEARTIMRRLLGRKEKLLDVTFLREVS